MAIGPDGRIIRRRIRVLTPVNTHQPSEKTGFFMGLFSAMISVVIVMLAFVILGWLGGWIFDLNWWNVKNFSVAGFFINLLIFPIYVAGVLEGLVYSNYSRYRVYSFLYGTFSIAILIFLDSLSKTDFNLWSYLWAVGYGFYCMWLASKMAN